MDIKEIIISLFGGGIITWLVMKIINIEQTRKKKIVHFSISQDDLGKGLVKDFPDFKLTFAGQELSEGVRVLKGGFIYLGQTDIETKDDKITIDMELIDKNGGKKTSSENICVKDVKVYSEKMVVNSSFDKNTIHFQINDIFQTNDYFIYTAILETHNINTIQRDCESTKIANTVIKYINLGSIRNNKDRKLSAQLKLTSLFVSFIGLFLISFSIFDFHIASFLFGVVLLIIWCGVFVNEILILSQGGRILKIIEKNI